MADASTHVRIKVSTLARLRAMMQGIVEAVERGSMEDPGIDPDPINPAGCGWSVDMMLNRLMDFKDGHRARERLSRVKAAARRLLDEMEATPPSGGVSE